MTTENDLTLASHPRVPLELQERIISEISIADKALTEASLVCQRWYAPAMQQFWACQPLIIDRRPSTHRLYEVLEDPNCRFAHFVQRLLIDGSYVEHGYADRPVILCKALDLLSRFPFQPQDITLKCFDSSLFSETYTSLKPFNKAPSLQFHHGRFACPAALQLYLCDFTCLENFALVSCTFSGFVRFIPSQANAKINFSSLRQLDLGMTLKIDDIISPLFARPCLVNSLKIHWETTQLENRERDAAVELLRYIGPSLKSFHLGISCDISCGNEVHAESIPLRLSTNTNLTFLSIQPITLPFDRRYSSRWLRGLLGSINSAFLQELSIKFVLSYTQRDEMERFWEPYLASFDWSSIDDVITSNSHFGQWKAIEIVIGKVGKENSIESELKACLPRLDASGKLTVIAEI